MTDSDDFPGLNRRKFLVGMGAAAAGSFAPGAGALSLGAVNSWDMATDVLVLGSGAAGVCAALEARRVGARVLLIESLPRFGGSSALSGGVVYAGGGTALQRALGVADSVENMFNFISGASGRYLPLDRIQLYCEQSPAHFDWLVAQGVPYSQKLASARTLPEGDESLYFSGNELAWSGREHASPAPRGHVPGALGFTGGQWLMEVLLAQLRALGVKLQAGTAGERLIIASDGRVRGMQVMMGGERKMVRVRRSIVLASGGFINNRDMVRAYAPQLHDLAVPWEHLGDLGGGINMGISAGGATVHMNQGSVMAPGYPAESVRSGIVVNAIGQRFIAEDSYRGVLGDAIAYHQRGRAWLITDRHSQIPEQQDSLRQAAEANTIGDLAQQLEFPRGVLQQTVAYHNRHAENGKDPLFHKTRAHLRPLQGPPYRAWDLSALEARTLGGLQTSLQGQVLNSFGEGIPGLYAAGRTTASLPGAPYIATGLDIGDSTFFGRQAGYAAAWDFR
jgi:3-oxo-5alpha-steroid 4-dehydrogenase